MSEAEETKNVRGTRRSGARESTRASLAANVHPLSTYPVGFIFPYYTSEQPDEQGRFRSLTEDWRWCNGKTYGSVTVPDLTGKFLRGGSLNEIGTCSGEPKHAHSVVQGLTGPPRPPANSDGWHVAQRDPPPQAAGLDHTHAFSGVTSDSYWIPPCFNVYFVMKIY